MTKHGYPWPTELVENTKLTKPEVMAIKHNFHGRIQFTSHMHVFAKRFVNFFPWLPWHIGSCLRTRARPLVKHSSGCHNAAACMSTKVLQWVLQTSKVPPLAIPIRVRDLRDLLSQFTSSVTCPICKKN